MKIRKLDKRYNGYQFWTHRAEPGPQRGHDARARVLLNFFDQREFLIRSFGPGAYIEEVWPLSRAGRTIPKWGFDTDGNIFLRDEALTHYQLAMEKWQ